MNNRLISNPISDYYLFKRITKDFYKIVASKNVKLKWIDFSVKRSKRLNKNYSFRMNCYKLTIAKKIKANIFFLKECPGAFNFAYGYVIGMDDLLIIKTDKNKLFFEIFVFKDLKNYYQLIFQTVFFKQFNFIFSEIRKNKKMIKSSIL